MSLMVHPAPLMMNAPIPNRLRYVKGVVIGRLSVYEAIVIDQAAANSFCHHQKVLVVEKGDVLHG